jgi:hypothetical protein
MAAKVIPLIAVSALVLAACDFSQTKPETTVARQSTSASPEAPAQPFAMRAAPGGMQDSIDPASGVSILGELRSGAERSIRLDGPGVSRKLQIRI